MRGVWGEALLDGLRREGRACNGSGLCPIGGGGTGIAGSTFAQRMGFGAACAFALALEEACFSCEGVGVVLEDLLERVLDVRCKVGCVAHRALSVPYSGGVLKLMPMPVAMARYNPACRSFERRVENLLR